MQFVFGLATGLFVGYIVLPMLPYLLGREQRYKNARKLSLDEILDEVRAGRKASPEAPMAPPPPPLVSETQLVQAHMGHALAQPLTFATDAQTRRVGRHAAPPAPEGHRRPVPQQRPAEG